MATKPTSRRLSEAELNAPDLDDEGNLDVETFPIPTAAVDDPYVRKVWEAALESLDEKEVPEVQTRPSQIKPHRI